LLKGGRISPKAKYRGIHLYCRYNRKRNTSVICFANATSLQAREAFYLHFVEIRLFITFCSELFDIFDERFEIFDRFAFVFPVIGHGGVCFIADSVFGPEGFCA